MRISDWISDVCSSDLTGVRRLADHADSIIGADEWRARLKEFDWVVLTAPATDDTRYMLGAPELAARSEEHTSELQSLMRNSYAVLCLKKKKISQLKQ